MLLYTF
jgi:hypothetical protein